MSKLADDLKIYQQLGDDFYERMDRASSEYIKLLKAHGIADENKYRTGTIRDADIGGIEIEWEDTWRYGGHEEGTCVFSIELLEDDTWKEAITAIANKKIDTVKGESDTKKQRIKENELKQLKALEKKYRGK